MKTYDELYDAIKRAVNEGFELGHINDWHDGAHHANCYFLDRLEEIREYEAARLAEIKVVYLSADGHAGVEV